MRLGRVSLIAAAWCAFVATAAAPAVMACSPPFEPPTIAALGPDQVVVVGRIGAKVPQGRLFHVERWFNGAAPRTPIVIAFKEGEAIGDCSYPVQEGARLIIAPVVQPEGLYADLSTLQADPDSAQGRAYVDEAVRLFGAGTVPGEVDPPASAIGSSTDVAPLVAGIGIAVAMLFGGVVLLARRRRDTG